MGSPCPEVLTDGLGDSRREQPLGPAGTRAGSGLASTAFVEFPPLAPRAGPALCECTIEVERASGTRVRVRLHAPTMTDVLVVSRWLGCTGR